MSDIMFVVKSGDGYLIGFKNDNPFMTTDIKEAAQFDSSEATDAVISLAILGFSGEIEPILVTDEVIKE